MRTAEVDNHLYCLNYSQEPTIPVILKGATKKSIQTFSVSSSISLFPDAYLNPPPVVLEDFQMSRISKNICVYKKNKCQSLLEMT